MAVSNISQSSPRLRGMLVFIPSSLALLLLFYGLTHWLVTLNQADTDGDAATRIKKLAALRESDARKLGTFAWINKEQGLVQIPIQQAMEQVIPQLNAETPHAAYPIATQFPQKAAQQK